MVLQIGPVAGPHVLVLAREVEELVAVSREFPVRVAVALLLMRHHADGDDHVRGVHAEHRVVLRALRIEEHVDEPFHRRQQTAVRCSAGTLPIDLEQLESGVGVDGFHAALVLDGRGREGGDEGLVELRHRRGGILASREGRDAEEDRCRKRDGA